MLSSASAQIGPKLTIWMIFNCTPDSTVATLIGSRTQGIQQMEPCAAAVKQWVTVRKLKLNNS